jgi:hypothetical protein|tara:strand:+ start:403 stop:1152 length:750 start_codon:yes stop_codon:yes gene_type:complete
MTLDFEYGSSESPRGHALIYFQNSLKQKTYASYVILLPIAVDVSKYVPPFLMNQVGEIGIGDMSAFAFPPAPEEVDSLDAIKEIASYRDDDLIFGGICNPEDVPSAMIKVNEVVEAYLDLYEKTDERNAVVADSHGITKNQSPVSDVMYSLMSETDRLEELTKLVGRLRYSVEAGEQSLSKDTEEDILTLSLYFPELYQIKTLLRWAKETNNDSAAAKTDLYLKRCFLLAREEYVELGKVEKDIAEATG